MSQLWFLVVFSITTLLLTALAAAWLFRVIPLLPLLGILALIGCCLNRFSYNTRAVFVNLGAAFLLALLFSKRSPAIAAAIMAFPVVFIVTVAIGNWMDKPNEEALAEAKCTQPGTTE